MQTNVFTLLLFFTFSSVFYAQEKTNTIEDQFTDVIEGSNSYQEFKVIKKTEINTLRKNVLDSVSALELKIETANSEIEKQKSEINTLTENLSTTKKELVISKEKEDGIELFGVITQKSTYNTILWSIIIGLLVILAFLFIKYKNSHGVTKAAKLKLAETEADFEAHRQKTLTNEQQLRRKLQDEINKNRSV
ncbi:hypothetical protein [Ulvibacter litoralis]|uniref:tRNA (Guanine-N1)-methyltransferase n=1 Tax=Ulvibacter litoralis TaxID=227084 RepID=A0A1G7F664_9FLAO|nr:hypothetical protein [Ulvibacter litoralis]GHC52509.1 hypothetical protein GCM10008083_15440 [Ulvibacter litoralis]SDE71371.1 hypothetical protein SAMN05421855_102359 [Ulvibacter litoralis]